MVSKELQSKTIAYLRFPLIFLVVFIHTNLTDVNVGGNIIVKEGDFFVHDVIRHILSEEFARIAVPLFFFISGYLFFYNMRKFTFSLYLDKLRKRFRTLIVPYVFWNLMALLLFYVIQELVPSLTSGGKKLIADYTQTDWFNVWCVYPICFQFWFIRDLILVVLCSPLICLYVRYLRIWGLIPLLILWCTGWVTNIVTISMVSIVFFSWGAWYAINGKLFIKEMDILRVPSSYVYLLILILNLWLWYNKSQWYMIFHNIGIVVGLIAVVTMLAYGIETSKMKSNLLLEESSFFIYAYHSLPIVFLVKLYVTRVNPSSELSMILGYFCIPIIIISIGLGLYVSLKKICPMFLKLITGGR